MKIRKLFTFRVIILLLCIFLSILIINPNFNSNGVSIRAVETNSSASFAGITVNPNALPTDYEIIILINDQQINSLEDYSSTILSSDQTVRITTDKAQYTLLKENLGLVVDEVADSNIIRGLELQGGTRALVKPTEELTDQQFDDLLETMENRLNVYGLRQLLIKKAIDLSGNNFIVIEIAGATKEEVSDLISKQGNFEAKIGNDIVFEGGEKDITYVCRDDGACSGIRSCDQLDSQFQCQFEFQIRLSEEASERQAAVTSNLGLNVSESGYQYLEKPLDLYLDGNLVDSLNIAADLKGKAAKDILISGPGIGSTEEDALNDATANMKKLQTVLITGSLPTSLEIVKLDSISPNLGSSFEKNALLVAVLAIIAVAVVIFIRYRKLKISVPMIIISCSEALIVLGFLTLIKYNLDLAAIAGIIAAVGTGVDDQVVITDEILGKESSNWKERYKKAFFIIIAAYFATLAAMIPLLRAGAGLLTGFAISTIAGITIGVFITRPAFASIIKVLLNE
ncbi:hypothetical protein J4425_00070 [Candidatus Woesearchaeota archaeon]|nr:hypothetical protein [Candidatus Woesearchaeota archaeon]